MSANNTHNAHNIRDVHTYDTYRLTGTGNPTKLIGVPICPDLLCYSDIGAADSLRGRVVRAFFWLIRWWD